MWDAGATQPALTTPLTVPMAARQAGISPRTLRRAIHTGQLPATRQGRRLLIALDALESWLATQPLPFPATPHLTLLPFPSAEPAAAVLPAPLSLFIGRDTERDDLRRLLERDDVRLITLTGPGGVGKTRLALRVARELAPRFPDGVAFVPLAPIRDASLVSTTIAQALGVHGGEDRDPLARLQAYLRDRAMLLVLDNFEQVLDAAVMLADLLQGCPGLTLLVTSRSPLRLSGERLFAVPPLAVPTLRQNPAPGPLPADSLASLAASDAVRLFVDRAEAANADFALTPTNAAAVAAICQRADGLPLAIELAAARSALLTPAALLARLDPQLPLLSDGPRDQPARLRTMHEAIAWSHDLLSPAEQQAFRRLAVFVGGCDVPGAEALLGLTGAETLSLVQRLVDQAVIFQSTGIAGEPRIGMLETIREFGLEQLGAHGDETAARDAHAARFLALAAEAGPQLAGPQQVYWVSRLEADLANIRAALDWLMAQSRLADAMRLIGDIGWFWSSAPHLEEGRVRLTAMLEAPGADAYPAELALVLATAGDVADWQGDSQLARQYFERALALYRELDNQPRVASMLRGLGGAAIDREEGDRAIALLHEGQALALSLGDEWEIAATTNLLGVAMGMRGDYLRAIELHRAAADSWITMQDLGHAGAAFASEGVAAFQANDLPLAATAFQTALQFALDGQDPWYTAWCTEGAGFLLSAQGDTARAVSMIAVGVTGQQTLGVPLRPHISEMEEQVLARARQKLGPRAYAAAWQEGLSTPREVMVAAAQEVFATTVQAVTPTPQATHTLTRRELDVLRLLTQGLSDREIAETLFVSRATASKHVATILSKMAVPSRTAAAARAHQLGIT
ncbi:MAG: LuxR C-terminal-related transcriptional regulator [Thermomicrobiales bacterium]